MVRAFVSFPKVRGQTSDFIKKGGKGGGQKFMASIIDYGQNSVKGRGQFSLSLFSCKNGGKNHRHFKIGGC